MAITKLMNIKQGKTGGSRHLKNSIHYIMNPKKTEAGKWIGGNAGMTSEEVYQTMMDTKMDWDKLEGRQGYHFVISFKPGEATEAVAYQILKEFCEEYLGDNFDYIFSIHNDHNHIHGHIVFNSVNRMTGYKYRYINGDWEKKIQPITDKICENNGLPPLEFDQENRKGKSYAQWEAEKKGKPNWKKIIRADIDYIISISNNETEFFQNMEKIGYHVRKGNSQKHGTYFAFRAAEQKRAWRSYKLGNGYSYADILARIEKEKFTQHHSRSPRLRSYKISKAVFGGPAVEFQKKRIRKWYFVTFRYHNVKNPFAVDYREVRKTLLQIDQLYENILYLNKHKIRSYEDLLAREEKVIEEEKTLSNQKYSTDFLKEDETYLRYQQLQEKLKKIPDSDEIFEQVLDEIEKQEQDLPDAVLKGGDAAKQIEEELQYIRREKRIIKRIKQEEETHPFFYKPAGQVKEQVQKNKKKEEVKEKWQTTKSI